MEFSEITMITFSLLVIDYSEYIYFKMCYEKFVILALIRRTNGMDKGPKIQRPYKQWCTVL